VTARGIYALTFRTYWDRAGFLLVLGVVVFLPLGLISALADRTGEIHVSHLSGIVDLGTVALILGLLAQAVTSMLGEVFYSGAVAVTLAGGESGRRPSLLEVARKLSYWRLIVVDLIFVAATAVGLLLLIVPGLIFFTWFALAGPMVELEDAGVRSALRRSRQLVRGRFWMVAAVLVPVTLVSEALSDAALQGAHAVIASPFLGDWLGETVANVILSPVYAVAAVLLALGLSRRNA
jgi:hypothetical protein